MKAISFLFFVALLFFAADTNSQIIQEYSTNINSFEIREGTIYNLSTEKPVYKLVNNIIKDGTSGKNLYIVVDGVLKNVSTKKKLYKYENNLISVYSSDNPLYEINDSGVIKSWSLGTGFYRIVGGFGTGELYMVLLAGGLL
jgi:hypothetical protein